MTHASIVTLDQYTVAPEILDDPSPDESRLGVLKPDISLPREVVLTLYAVDNIGSLPQLIALDERGSESIGLRGVPLGHIPHMALPEVAAAWTERCAQGLPTNMAGGGGSRGGRRR